MKLGIDKKVYLGDSVYVAVNKQNQIVLTTENGLGPSNTIILELDIFNNLVEVIQQYTQDEHINRLSNRNNHKIYYLDKIITRTHSWLIEETTAHKIKPLMDEIRELAKKALEGEEV